MARKKAGVKQARLDPKWMLLAGRVLVAMLFLVSGWGKMKDPNGTAAFMASTGMPFTSVWLACLAGLLELACGLALLVGWKARQAVMILSGYLVLATYFIHLVPAWGMQAGAARENQIMHVSLNLGLLGGMLAMIVAGPGGISWDKK